MVSAIVGHSSVVAEGLSDPRGGDATGSRVDPVAAREPVPDIDTIFRTQFVFVWRCLRRLGVAQHSADDVAQEVFLTVHRRLGEFEGRSSLKTWIFGIVVNTVRHHRRSLARRGQSQPLSDEVSIAAEGSPLESAAKTEAARLLASFLEGLDDDKREVFVLVEIEEMTAPDVAAATGTNLHTVYSRTRAVRQEFEQYVARVRARDPWSKP